MSRRSDPNSFAIDDFTAALSVSRETAARFEAWREALQRWNARINLVGPTTLADFWRRHALDGAQLADLAADDAEEWIDFGSGAGVPGIAVALIRQARGLKTRMRLVESNAKKAAFLREAARAAGLNEIVRVEAARLETIDAAPVDIVTARAFAPLDRLLGFAAPWWGQETRGLFLKGRDAEAEIAAAREHFAFNAELAPSRSDPEGRIVILERLTRARVP